MADAWPGLETALRQSADLNQHAARCEWSDLKPSHCAHCLNHKAEGDPEGFVKSKVLYG